MGRPIAAMIPRRKAVAETRRAGKTQLLESRFWHLYPLFTGVGWRTVLACFNAQCVTGPGEMKYGTKSGACQDKVVANGKRRKKCLVHPWWDVWSKKKNSVPADDLSMTAKESVWIERWLQSHRVGLKLDTWERSAAGVDRGLRSVKLRDEDGNSVSQILLERLCEQGQLEEACTSVEGLSENVSTELLYYLLQQCVHKKHLVAGRRVHAVIRKNGLEGNDFLGNHLIRMYSSFGKVVEAAEVFSKLQAPGVFAWAAIISAHSKHGKCDEAIELYRQMRDAGVAANDHIYVAALQACTTADALAVGKEIHAHVVKSGCGSSVFVGSSLISMYVRCGSLRDARRVFDDLSTRNVVTWNAIIAGYAQHRGIQEALNLFQQMQLFGTQPNLATYLTLLKACSSEQAVAHGKLLHQSIIKNGYESDVYVASRLIDMYARCGSIWDARKVFDNLAVKDLVVWTTMITGYAQQGDSERALSLFQALVNKGLQPNSVTTLSILKACTNGMALEQGRLIESYISGSPFQSDVLVANTLVNMYTKCKSLGDARKVFDRLPSKTPVAWTALISGYAEDGDAQAAFHLFEQMQGFGLQPNRVTFVSILKACSSTAALEMGKLIHGQIMHYDLESDLFVGSSLIDMYSKCGVLEKAHMMFNQLPDRDLVVWNALIAGYSRQGASDTVFQLFKQMQQQGLQPDKPTLISVVKTCFSLAHLAMGKEIHTHIVGTRFESDAAVSSALIDMYVNCGSLEDAHRVFDKLPSKDISTWNAMIAGYAQQGACQEAFKLFGQMQQKGIKPNKFTLLGILQACSSPASLDQCKLLDVILNFAVTDVYVANAALDMYARCGRLKDARGVFDRVLTKTVVTWNAMIAGYCQNGESQTGLQLFEHMQREGIKPDEVTFSCVLSACSHAGLLDEAFQLFRSMSLVFGITPRMDHYVCMVDLFGRAGRLTEAEDFIHGLPLRPATVIWMALLSACQMHGNVEMGRRVFDIITEQDPTNLSAHVLMSHIYAGACRWEDAADIRRKMQKKEEPGWMWMGMNIMEPVASAHDVRHLKGRAICAKLQENAPLKE